MADRRTEDLELGREEPAHSGRARRRGRVGKGTGHRAPRTTTPFTARAKDRSRGPFLHDGAALVFAVEFRSDRYRRLSPRKPESRIQTVRRRRLDRLARPETFLR